MDKEIRQRGIVILLVAAILICTLVVYLSSTVSWFANNRLTDADSMAGTVTGDLALGSMNIYRYDPVTDTLVAVEDIDFSAYPSMSETYVLLLKNDFNAAVDFSYGFEEFAVDYYGLQQFNDADDLDAFLEQYIAAGPYIKTIGSVPIDFRDITTEDYLSFVHPCSNAIQLQLGTLSITDALLGVGTPDEQSIEEYIADEITGENVTFGAAQTLFSSTHGVTSLSAAADTNTVWVLDPDVLADTYFPLDGTGTAATFPTQTLDTGGKTAVVLQMTFDETVHSQSTLGTAPDSYLAQLLNSNPFMFQRLRIEKITCNTTVATP